VTDDAEGETRAPILSVKEAGRVLGMGSASAYEHVRRGTFPVPVTMIGGRRRILRADLDRFLAGKGAPKRDRARHSATA
jgi:excisionase family DNA binding protein